MRGRMKLRKRFLVILVLAALLGSRRYTEGVWAAKEEPVKTGDFVSGLVKALDKKGKSKQGTGSIREEKDRAMEMGLLTKEESRLLEKPLTNEWAAVLANRGDEWLHGTKFDEQLYDIVIQKKRISDLDTVSFANQSAVVKAFIKGLMAGSGNGVCSKDRSIGGKENIKRSQADLLLKRVASRVKRFSLSPDGQVIRTTGLPANYKDYPYILESFPNQYYEAPFHYQTWKAFSKPVELKNYASPARVGEMAFDKKGTTCRTVMDKYLDQWCEKVENNIRLRFHVDYRTINNQWISDLRETYYLFPDGEANKKETNAIKDYVKKVKKNKVIVEAAKVTAEPTGFYFSDGYLIRVYVKFRVLSGPVIMASGRQKKYGGAELTELVYSDLTYVEGFKKGQWMERYFDVEIGTRNFASNGSDYGVYGYQLIDANMRQNP